MGGSLVKPTTVFPQLNHYKSRFVLWKSRQSSFWSDKTKVSQGYERYSFVEAKEKLTQGLGVQTTHKIAPSSVSSLLEGDPGDECHVLALFALQYLHVCLVKTCLCLEGWAKAVLPGSTQA